MENLHCQRINRIANELIRSYRQRIELTSHPHSLQQLNSIDSDIAFLHEDMQVHKLQCPFCRLGCMFSASREPSPLAHKPTNSYVA